jgi:superoxide reductase
MVKKKGVYKCDVCGSVVESLWNGSGCTITCCNQPMRELLPNTTDAVKEKHVPMIIRDGDRVTVKVGEIAHPMTAEHYILFVELLVGEKVLRHDFKEGDTVAEATFLVEDRDAPLQAREFCNLHGFWGTR